MISPADSGGGSASGEDGHHEAQAQAPPRYPSNLQPGEVTGGQVVEPTQNRLSCIQVCPVPSGHVSCGGTCQASCFNLC